MNSRNTWRWIFVAVALFAFILFQQRFLRKPGSGPDRILPKLKAAAATSVQVRPAAQLEIRADRTNGTWQLTEPLVYPAQALSIEKLLAELERLTPASYIKARELQDRPQTDEEYGFAAPQASITIEQPGYTARLRVGAKTTPGDQVFLQVVGVEGVYVVNADFLNYLPRTADDWRDTTLINLSGLAFDRLAVTNGTKIFELRRDAANKPWRMVYPLQARANNAKTEESLQMLQSVRVRRFVSRGSQGGRRGVWPAASRTGSGPGPGHQHRRPAPVRQEPDQRHPAGLCAAPGHEWHRRRAQRPAGALVCPGQRFPRPVSIDVDRSRGGH